MNIESPTCTKKISWYERFVPESLKYAIYRYKTRNEESNLVQHAKTELKHMMTPSSNEMDQLMAKQVIEMVELFSTHNHSGSSAPYAIGLFSRLANYEPIRPLTGEDDEWLFVYDSKDHDVYQNIRASHVFKHVYHDATNSDYAYDINGKVFCESDGGSYTNSDSFVEVTFPYTPKTEYINVETETKET